MITVVASRIAADDAALLHPPHPLGHRRLRDAELAGDVGEALARETLSLPLYPELSTRDAMTVVAAVNELAVSRLANTA